MKNLTVFLCSIAFLASVSTAWTARINHDLRFEVKARVVQNGRSKNIGVSGASVKVWKKGSNKVSTAKTDSMGYARIKNYDVGQWDYLITHPKYTGIYGDEVKTFVLRSSYANRPGPHRVSYSMYPRIGPGVFKGTVKGRENGRSVYVAGATLTFTNVNPHTKERVICKSGPRGKYVCTVRGGRYTIVAKSPKHGSYTSKPGQHVVRPTTRKDKYGRRETRMLDITLKQIGTTPTRPTRVTRPTRPVIPTRRPTPTRPTRVTRPTRPVIPTRRPTRPTRVAQRPTRPTTPARRPTRPTPPTKRPTRPLTKRPRQTHLVVKVTGKSTKASRFTPLAGAKVMVWQNNVRQSKTTNSSGAVSFTGIPKGYYRMLVTHPSYATSRGYPTSSVSVSDTRPTNKSFSLYQLHGKNTYSVRVTANGQAASGATVKLTNKLNPDFAEAVTAKTDGRGMAVLNVIGGQYKLEVSKSGCTPYSRSVSVPPKIHPTTRASSIAVGLRGGSGSRPRTMADQLAQRKAQAQARAEAARKANEARAKAAAEARAKAEADRKARDAKRRADEARRHAQEKARRDAHEKARREAQARAQADARARNRAHAAAMARKQEENRRMMELERRRAQQARANLPSTKIPITGYVKNRRNRQPIAGASVRFVDKANSRKYFVVNTKSNGTWAISVPAGTYYVFITAKNFRALTRIGPYTIRKLSGQAAKRPYNIPLMMEPLRR